MRPMTMIQKTAIAAALLFGACQSGPIQAAPETPPAEAAQGTTDDHADHTNESDLAATADHVHDDNIENILTEGEYDEADLVPQPGASVGDIAICPVSGEAFTVTIDSPFFEHDGGTYYFCCPSCVRPFQRDPAAHLGGGSDMQVVTAAGTAFDPAVEKSQVPEGSWICDMGTVHYAQTEQGNGTCPRCNMRLVEHTH